MTRVQRLFDIVFAGMALVVLSPFLLPIALVLSLTGEGDVFYRQERVGLRGRHFGLLKFATMLRNSPNIGSGEITVRNDTRVLPVGRFLRKTKLNELPQLWNILIGDLSVVGPRPMVPTTYAEYPAEARRELNMVRPGLSGVGSLVFRDEEQWLDAAADPRAFYRDVIIPYKASLEQWFLRHRSLTVYFQVILMTLIALVWPSTDLPWRIWPTLPLLPDRLRGGSGKTVNG